jgi:hypothetical protein
MPELKPLNAIESLPKTLPGDSFTLIAGTDRTALNRVGLQLLARYGDVADAAVVVTTRRDAKATIEEYAAVGDSRKPDIAIIDTTSTEQNLPATYGEIPTAFTPSPTDLERTGMALVELSNRLCGSRRPVHLLVHSVSDIVAGTNLERVLKLFDQTARKEGSISGQIFLSIDYTAHDKETLDRLNGLADGVVWVEQGEAGLSLTYEETNRTD